MTCVGAAALVVALLRSEHFSVGTAQWIRLAVAVDLAGLILHLESQFFEVTTLRRLVYSAPFIAPLLFVNLPLLALIGLWGLYAKGVECEHVSGY